MKPIIFASGLLLAGWMTAPLARQPPASTAEPAHKVFVLTGCLEGNAAPASLFRLARATAIGQAPQTTRGATSPTPGSAGTSDSYELLPIASVGEQGIKREELQSHIGMRVEVIVRPVEASATAPSSASTDAHTKSEESSPQRYTVIKITRLADSCG